MTIYHKILLYLILYCFGVQCFRNRKKLEFTHGKYGNFDFNPFNLRSSNIFSDLSQGQDEAHVQVVNFGKSTFTPLHSTHQTTLHSSTTLRTTPRSKFSSKTFHATTTTPNIHTSTTSNNKIRSVITNRSLPKYSHTLEETKDSITDKSTYFIKERTQTLAHISSHVQSYFLRALVRDFAERLSKKAHSRMLTSSELAAIKNICTTCSLEEINSVLNILLTIMEKYSAFNSDRSLTGHLAAEYDQASDYLNRKIEQLHSEMVFMRYDSDFLDIKRRYQRRERNGGIMRLFLDWYETYTREKVDNVDDIQQKLLKYLTAQKRYWLINIKGVL